jgi:hypothetical protein
MTAITKAILDGTEPGDSVDITVRDFGVAINDDEVLITVDGGNVGLLRLCFEKQLANALVLSVAKGLCEMENLCL